MVTRSGSESAFILRMTWPRRALTVTSLTPSSPPTRLFNKLETTREAARTVARGRDRNSCADGNVSGTTTTRRR
jgi:hypothetical protein